MAKATKLPSGNWRVSCYVGRDVSGKQIRKSITAPTKKEAELLAAQFAVKKKHNKIPNNKTVAMAFDEYCESVGNLLSPATLSAYRSVRRSFPPSFANLPLNRITNAAIQRYVNDCSLRLASSSVQLYLAKLSVVLAYNKIEMPEIITPRKERHEISIPTSAEVAVILDRVAGTSWEIPVLLAAHMGMRRGEIAALTWEDVDMTNGIIHVHHALVTGDDGTIYDRQPKTNASYRDLVMPDSVKEVLSRVNPASSHDRVCRLSLHVLSAFSKISQKHCGVPYTFHSLRHYYASVLLSLGVPNKYAQKRTGHETDGTLKRVYQHIMADRDAEIDGDINHFFSAGRKSHESVHDF